MKKLAVCVVLCLGPVLANAQQRIDGSFPFQADPSKDYSLYIPSGYTPGTPHHLMLGLHPLNTARWNSVSWCDTLVAFAETNDLILACPDGGSDGRIDDPIDVAFTTALLDSMEVWYDIDPSRVYAMGFSWGGRATYTYGLSNVGRFAGFVPIGAAINGTNEVNGIIQNATGKPFYIVHGANDNPNVRFHPIRNALIAEGAIVESILMPGVGHTIDFPNRNQILTDAFQWIAGQGDPTASPIAGVAGEVSERLGLAPNPVARGEAVRVAPSFGEGYRLEVFDVAGRRVWSDDVSESFRFDTAGLAPGAYFVRATAGSRRAAERLVIR
jgi:predicted esterase